MKRTAFLVALLLVVGVSAAAPVTFKCTTAEGIPAADIIVDIENRSLVWGEGHKYEIHAVNDRFISAYLKDQEVGGEVWVLNRITGEYLRASAYLGFSRGEHPRNKDQGRLIAATYSGKCSRPLL